METAIPESSVQIDESFKGLEGMADANPLSAAAPSAPAQPAPPVDDKSKATEDAGQPSAKKDGDTSTSTATTPPKEKETKPDAKPPETEPEHKTNKELRTAYETLKAQHKEATQKLQELANAKPAEVKPPDPTEHPDFKAMKEKVEAVSKRNQELEQEIQYVDYEKSAEFQEKHQKPYTELSQRLTKAATSLTGVDEGGNPRAVTAEEFWQIISIPDDENALAAAEKIYGSPTKAARVASMRDAIRESWEAMGRAKAEFKTKGGERAKELQAKMEADVKRDREAFNKLNDEAVKAHPDYFAPVEGDSKGNELLTKGYEYVDQAFDPKVATQMTPEERVALHSKIRNRAAGFDRMAYWVKDLRKQIAERDAKLKAYEESRPAGGEIPGGAKKEGDSWEAELDKLGA